MLIPAVMVLALAAASFPQLIVQANAQPNPGDYTVIELFPDVLSSITLGGVRTVIYIFAPNTVPNPVAIDSAGNYIVTEYIAK